MGGKDQAAGYRSAKTGPNYRSSQAPQRCGFGNGSRQRLARRERDLVTKREEYARAGIGEYWIIDPEQQTITVLGLDGEQYRLHGEFALGQRAASAVLPGFEVDVATVFAAGE